MHLECCGMMRTHVGAEVVAYACMTESFAESGTKDDNLRSPYALFAGTSPTAA